MGFNRIEPNQNSLGFSAWLKPLLLLIIWVLGSSVLATKVEAATIPDIPDQVPGTTYTLPSGYTYTSSNTKVATVSGLTVTNIAAGATMITANGSVERPLHVLSASKDAIGSTRVSRWKDDKTGVFLLMFDDVLASHADVVAPELNKRNLRGTFYTNPYQWPQATNEYRAMWSKYEDNVACGNHTWDHKPISAAPDITATKGSDYTATDGILRWEAGDVSPKTFKVTIKADAIAEYDEIISLALSPRSANTVLGNIPKAKISIIDDDAPGGFIEFSAESYSVNEGNSGYTTKKIGVKRIGGSGAASVDITNFYIEPSHDPATAVADEKWRKDKSIVDYEPESDTLKWAAGETGEKFFTITKIKGDTTKEFDETMNLFLSNADGARLKVGPWDDVPSMATLTIVNDDGKNGGPGNLIFKSARYSVTEPASGTVTANITIQRVNGSAGEMGSLFIASAGTIARAGTATAGVDYVETQKYIKWGDGESGDKQFTITIKGDTLSEDAETVIITKNSTGETATLTIVEPSDSVIQFDKAMTTVTEGNIEISLTVTRSGEGTGAVEVNYSVGEGDKPINLELYDMFDSEKIKPCQNAIFNNDGIPGKNPRLMSFAMPGTTPAYWWPMFSTKHPDDYKKLLADNNLVDRPPFGPSKAASNVGDWINTATEALALADSAITTRGMQYLVFHGVKPGESFYFGNFAYDKDAGGKELKTGKNPEFNNILEGLETRMKKGLLWVTDHVSSHQYDQEFRGVTIETLENSPTKIRLKLSHQKDQDLYDLPLTFTTRVPASWTVCHLTEGGNPAKEVTIKGSMVTYDAHMGEVILKSTTSSLPTVSFVTVDQSKAEDAGVATMTIQLSAVSAETVTVPFTVTGTAVAPGDYTINASPVIISAGATSASLTITINDDSLVEKSETVKVTLGTPTNATLGTAKINTLTITDNDVAAGGNLQFTTETFDQAEGDTGSSTKAITVSRTGTAVGAVTVDFATSDGSATLANNDYEIATGTLNWANGEMGNKSFTVTINGDTDSEPNETINLTLSNPTGGAVLVLSDAELTITNDEAVELPPEITVQPTRSQDIASGSAVTLTVTAIGNTLSYQWYEGLTGSTANPISGETAATFTTPALTATTNYWVRVSNLAGDADSNDATVRINPAGNANASSDGGGGGSCGLGSSVAAMLVGFLIFANLCLRQSTSQTNRNKM